MQQAKAYMLGMSFWVVVQLMIFTIQPGDTANLLTLAALAGIGVSAAYTLPDSMFADVIEWDELRTRRRQEGIFYGIRTLIRKLTGALIIFLHCAWLAWIFRPDEFAIAQTDLYWNDLAACFLWRGSLV
jgi:GPH family glycoside/pentoside/hexuronide:cation symporter